MKQEFKTHNEGVINEGSFFLGKINASYNDLKKVFGNPTKGDGHKTDAKWLVLFENKIFASIYNYKNGPNYLGERATQVDNIRNWHIGGRDKKAVNLVKKVLIENKISTH